MWVGDEDTGGAVGGCWMGHFGLCTLFLTGRPQCYWGWVGDGGDGGGGVGMGAQSSRSETLKHQRERHYPERTRKTEKKQQH